MKRHCIALSSLCSLLAACAGGSHPAAQAPAVTVSVVTTTDLHGHVDAAPFTLKDSAGVAQKAERGGLPLIAGYVNNLRARRPVVLVDAGDLFQGTLTSNLSEGQAVIDAYNAMGYAATAIGNHEFDYGPVGPGAVPRAGSNEDPRGALKARIAAARFPFLSANLIATDTGKSPDWPNMAPSLLYPVPGAPGLTIGIIGATTTATPRTTNSKNLVGLRFDPIAPAVRAEAKRLRAAGAAAIVLTVHEGANCKSFDDPRDLKPCENDDGHVLGIARELAGEVDVITAGHSHAGVAHFVGPVAVVQAFNGGRYLGRVDLSFSRRGGAYVLDAAATRILPPQEICGVQPATATEAAAALSRLREKRGARGAERPELLCDSEALSGARVEPASYEGQPVVADAKVAAALAPYSARAAAVRNAPLGVVARGKINRAYRTESPLGLLLADLLHEGSEKATGKKVDVAFQNGGGIRAALPAGALTYGDVYEVLPFDNTLVLAEVPVAGLIELFKRNLRSGAGILLPSDGLWVEARCEGDDLQVTLKGPGGAVLPPDRKLTVALSDFLAAGGDNFAALMGGVPPTAVRSYEDLPPLRDLVVEALKKQKELVAPKGAPRLLLPMPRPVRCGASAAGAGGTPAADE